MPPATQTGVQTTVQRPVAVSTVLRPLLERPSTGRVLSVFPTALYVQLGEGPAAGVLAVVTSDGLRLPLAAVLAETSAARPFAAHRAGDHVEMGPAGLQVGEVRYRTARWWSPRTAADARPRAEAVRELAAALVPTAPAHEPAVERALARATQALRAALRSDDVRRAAAAADAVLGLGPGLTPSGDDLLAGVLVTWRCLGGDGAAAGLAGHVPRTAAGRTTSLSAALLRCAAEGAAAPPVLDLVDAVAGRRPLAAALRGVLAVGSTSGHDTARGVLLAAEVLLDRTAQEEEDR